MRWILLMLVICWGASGVVAASSMHDLPVEAAPLKPGEQSEKEDARQEGMQENNYPSGQQEIKSDSGAQHEAAYCFVIGPLVSVAQITKVEQAMVETGITTSRVVREVESGFDFWVYMTPQPSSRATARMLQELKASGIDNFLIAEGELEGSIAMGIFGVASEAEKRRAHLASLGYAVDLYKMQRWAREYWLLGDEIPGDARWDAVLERLGKGAVEEKIYPRDCKTVASVMRFP